MGQQMGQQMGKGLLLALCFGLLAAAPAWGEMPPPCAEAPPRGGHEGHEPRPEGAMPFLPPGLKLSTSQEDQLFEAWLVQVRQRRELEKELRSINGELDGLGFSDRLDEAAARKLLERRAKLMVNQELLQLQWQHKVYSLLDGEQRKQLQMPSRGGRGEGAGMPPMPSPGGPGMRHP